MAGAARLSRWILGRDRHGDRGQRRAGDHDQQRPGAADAVALAWHRHAHGIAGGHPLGATRGHRRSVVRRLRILPPRAECTEPGLRRHAGAGRGRAIRARAHRLGLLAGCQPCRRHRRTRGRFRHLDLHAADPHHRLGRRHAARLAHRRAFRPRVAQARRAVRARIPRIAVARRGVVAGRERCSAGRAVMAVSTGDRRTAAHRRAPAARRLFRRRGSASCCRAARPSATSCCSPKGC